MNQVISKLWDQAVSLTAELQLRANAWETEVNFMNTFVQLVVQEVFARIEDEGFEVREPVEDAVMKHFGIES